MRRKSVQREMIYEFIRRTDMHPTAQDVFTALKRKVPSLSLGNTYRNLDILVEEGRIQQRSFSDGIERYDAITGLHYHFVCDSCGKVSDFEMPFQEHVVAAAQKYTGNIIHGHTIQFHGICHECSNKKKKPKGG